MIVKIKVLLAILVIMGAVYWGFTAVRTYSYSGSSIMFPVGSGNVTVTNTGDETIPMELRAEGRAGAFRVVSSEIGLAESSKRQGSGRDAYNSLSFDLPPGKATIFVTRGSDVQLISRSDTQIDAVVSPQSARATRWTLIASGALIVFALYYISRVTNHTWLGWLRSKMSRDELPAVQKPA